MTDTRRTLLFKEIFETEEVEKTESSMKQHFLIGRTDLARSPVFINYKLLDDLIVALAELFLHRYSVVSLVSWKAYELYQQKNVASLSPDTNLLVKLNPANMKMEGMQGLKSHDHVISIYNHHLGLDGWPSDDKAIEQVLLNKKNLPLQIYTKLETQVSLRAATTPTGKRCRLNSSTSDNFPTDTLISKEDHPAPLNTVPAIEAITQTPLPPPSNCLSLGVMPKVLCLHGNIIVTSSSSPCTVFPHDADLSALDFAQNNPSAAQSPVPNLLPSKILKPQGEVTRISRGGYNLQVTLGWPVADYEETRLHCCPKPRSSERPTEGTLTYKPYIAFRGHPANVAPHVLVPHIPASNPTSQIAISTPAETPFQFSNPGSAPILHSGPPIPISTPPPVATTPITPTWCLSCNSVLSPSQLPFETLELGRINWKIVVQGVPTSLIALHIIQEIPVCQVVQLHMQPIFSMPLLNGVKDITMGFYPDPATRITDASTRDSSPTQSRATSPPTHIMNTSANLILTSSPMVPQIHTPIPVKPLPLPASTIEDRLNQLVAQRFLKLSQNVLMPALKNAVDALVPSIIKQLTDRLSNGLKASIHPQPSTCKADILSDTQSSDDEDGLKPHLRCKCPGKRGSKNHLHVAFHTYLQEKGLLKGKNNLLPKSPPTETVQAFNKDNNGCPTLGNLSIDWSDSLKKSPWNTEAVNLLAVDFQMKVKTGIYSKVVFNDKTMNLDDLRLLCINKLQPHSNSVLTALHSSVQFSNHEDMNHASHEMSALK
ncbi:uncharacterized protein EDB93DRAFT_1253719 [Suillus bovinus]|uniref:uncharacterized protein n=1 Tax=Suillus bovinus TaxID=48563 RepID=UPI001B86AE9D|nr:uncharacterized protein EDB93DRAFT_1253719 [Suillus bovinus]KAG2137102.1 hypothetical protein EDB93DRAFT_1253719 [Suillus bovinus]